MSLTAATEARLALAIGATVLVGLSLLSPRQDARTVPIGSAPTQRVQGDIGLHPPPHPHPTPPTDRVDRRARISRHAATATGRRFLTAFLAYEVDPRGHRERAALAATADAGLLHTLVVSPPRQVGGAGRRRGRLIRLRAGDDAAGESLPLLATVRRGRRTTELVLVMERKDARWLAARLGD